MIDRHSSWHRPAVGIVGAVDGGTARLIVRWLLLCALLLGVVGMHQLAAPRPAAPDLAAAGVAVGVVGALHDHGRPIGHDAPTAPAPEPGPGHGVWHLCLAVVCAVGAGTVLLWLLVSVVRRADERFTARSPWTPGRVDRPPCRSGRDLLASTCVLRL